MMVLLIILIVLVILYIAFSLLALLKNDKSDINDKNPYLHPETAKEVLPEDMVPFVNDMPVAAKGQKTFYEKFVKRPCDSVLSFLGLLILSPLFAVLCLAIVIDDPGPIFFTQNRVGADKKFFRLHKFRSMKMSTPHDMPTHMLENPEQYITRVGGFLRKFSLDELPQIWDIFRGKMSIIGPRPALWNQDDLIAERDKYGANDVKPGLTGWAQINGRDALNDAAKAAMDGEYVRRISFLFDCRCFFGTFLKVFRHEGVKE